MKPNAFLLVFRGIERVYGIFVTYDHVTSGWQGLKTIRAIVGDIAPFLMAAAVAFIPVLIFAEVEIIMILYNIVKEQIEARHKRREERQRERLAKARTEARAGLAEGRRSCGGSE